MVHITCVKRGKISTNTDRRKAARKKERKNLALRLFDLGDSIEKISAVVEESEETITDWLREAGRIQ